MRYGFVKAYRLGKETHLFQNELRERGLTPRQVGDYNEPDLIARLDRLREEHDAVRYLLSRKLQFTLLGHIGFSLAALRHPIRVLKTNEYIKNTDTADWIFC